MRIVFAGPSLYGHDVDASGIEFRAPAAQGDVLRAVLEGATVIGLIDGNFEATASVWHKEILFALTQGVTVFGGASMGALRAAECAAFGMIPVGKVAHAYLQGGLDDDADVAVTHGPAELGSPPLSEAMVDVVATTEALVTAGHLSAAEGSHLRACAAAIFFKERTIEALVGAAFPERADEMLGLYRGNRVALKSSDALEVVARVRQAPARRSAVPAAFTLNLPSSWQRVYDEVTVGLKDAPRSPTTSQSIG